MEAPWLSLVTVTKDDPTGLARTLASTAGLRSAGAQHIVVDGSADRGGVAQSLSRWRDGIEHVRREPLGIADAFNTGLTRVRGGWVWYLNGGDAMHESLDIAWVKSLLASTRAEIVTGALQFEGEEEPRRIPPLRYQWPLLACWLLHPATIVRAGTLREAGGFNVRWRIAADYDLWHRVLRRDPMIDVISLPFARFSPGGVSERLETQSRARREDAEVILAHARGLAGAGLWLGLRVARRLAMATSRWAVSHFRRDE